MKIQMVPAIHGLLNGNIYSQNDSSFCSLFFSSNSILNCFLLEWAQVVAYIEETRAETKGSALTVFRLAELRDMYSSCLGLDVSDWVHSTVFKEGLLGNNSGLQANKKGRDIFLAFNDKVATALQQAWERDFDDEVITLHMTTRIIRRDMLDSKSKLYDRRADNSEYFSTYSFQCDQRAPWQRYDRCLNWMTIPEIASHHFLFIYM